MDALTSSARAKINLTLHVGPVDARGYHPLNSLVVFADVGDVLTAQRANEWGLDITGPFAEGLPTDDSNLILSMAKAVAQQQKSPVKLRYALEKNLPIASGIGGGSSDAAAAVRLLLQASPAASNNFADVVLKYGADIPVCLESRTCRMQGIGEQLTPLPGLGTLHAVLVNPGVAVSTGAIFKAFDERSIKNYPVSQPTNDLLSMAKAGRNDLQAIAIDLCSEIQTVLDALVETEHCDLARMSGSGATCFGLYPNAITAQNAAEEIRLQHPEWWCVQTELGDRD